MTRLKQVAILLIPCLLAAGDKTGTPIGENNEHTAQDRSKPITLRYPVPKKDYYSERLAGGAQLQQVFTEFVENHYPAQRRVLTEKVMQLTESCSSNQTKLFGVGKSIAKIQKTIIEIENNIAAMNNSFAGLMMVGFSALANATVSPAARLNPAASFLMPQVPKSKQSQQGVSNTYPMGGPRFPSQTGQNLPVPPVPNNGTANAPAQGQTLTHPSLDANITANVQASRPRAKTPRQELGDEKSDAVINALANVANNEVKTTKWTPEELQLLREKFNAFGADWVKIKTFFPNRSVNEVKCEGFRIAFAPVDRAKVYEKRSDESNS